MFGSVKSEVQNHWTVLVLDLLLKKIFCTWARYKWRENTRETWHTTLPPQNRNYYLDRGSVFEESSNASVGSRCWGFIPFKTPSLSFSLFLGSGTQLKDKGGPEREESKRRVKSAFVFCKVPWLIFLIVYTKITWNHENSELFFKIQ